MSNQTFKIEVPRAVLHTFLQEFGIVQDKCYILSKAAFKKAKIKNGLAPWLTSLMPYYHLSKRFYLTRGMTYRNLVTVIRQICKSLDIGFSSAIHYSRSQYEIVYTIHSSTAT